MKKLKLTLAITLLTVSSVVCQAQEQGTQNEKQDKVSQKLNLSPDQTEKFKALRTELNTRNNAIKEKMAPLKAQMKTLREEKKTSNQAFMKDIEEVLTPEQFTKFKEMKAARKERMSSKKR